MSQEEILSYDPPHRLTSKYRQTLPMREQVQKKPAASEKRFPDQLFAVQA